MTSEWIALVAGWLMVLIISAPIWLVPLNERWTPRDVTWSEEEEWHEQ